LVTGGVTAGIVGKNMVEQRGATFPEISGHITSTEAKGQGCSLEKNRICYEIKSLQKSCQQKSGNSGHVKLENSFTKAQVFY